MLHLKIALVRFLVKRFRLSAAELHQVVKVDGTPTYFVIGYIHLIGRLYLAYAHKARMGFALFLRERARLTKAGVPLNEKRIHNEEVFGDVFRSHPIVRPDDLDKLTARIRLIWADKLPTI